ncbi:hypothetical protein PISMIDRAFT_594512 [Pisolithus microcarpus 441]|uniref:Unplaced genomic scaffold scaffold_81, whole genome shotgun sequence n=1 Tax=Pisolithus microcarpus 441 TaxID=765257 RepID=A0A0C9ZD58_9AGAM|nr:hypothetical protein PISMIDRAFT_594512 [Pisolithus microcarpus 441]
MPVVLFSVGYLDGRNTKVVWTSSFFAVPKMKMCEELHFRCLCSKSCCGHPSPSPALGTEASPTCYFRHRSNGACDDMVVALQPFDLRYLVPTKTGPDGLRTVTLSDT